MDWQVATGRKNVVMIGTSMDAQGGVATVARSLVSKLSDLFFIDYVETHVDGSSFRKLIVAANAWFSLLARLGSHRLDLLHVHVSSRASFWRKSLLVFPALLLGKPVLLHLHSGGFRLFYEQESSWLGKRFIRFVFESSAAVVVLSSEGKRWVEGVFSRAKVRVIYNPAPDVSCSSTREPMSLLFLGRLCDKKGTGDLLRAVAVLAGEFKDAKVFLGGDGDLPAMKQLAQDLGLQGNVEFLGWVDGSRKQDLLERCAVFVLPSYNEGLPMGLLEAMGHGMPVVTTPVGGIPEAVTNGVEGFLIEPGDIAALADRLARLLRDVKLRDEMGAAGARKVAAAFTMERVLPQWVELYSEHGVLPWGNQRQGVG